MNDHLPTPAQDPEAQAISHQAAAQPGSLLRLRDVQALNRSFRRLAEVQEALLQQMAALEEERQRGRSWSAPLFAIGGTVIGLGLAALAFVWWRGQQEPSQIVVQGDPPSVTIEPAPLTLEVPRDPALEEIVGVMRDQMSAFREDQQNTRAQLTDMTERMYASEQEKIALLNRIAERPEPTAAPAEQAASVLQTPGGEATPSDPWVGVVNGLLATDGYSGLRFQRAKRLAGEPRLEDVVLLEWGADGLASAVIRAARVEFELHRMLGTLVLRFHEGFRTANGARIALPSEGLRLDLDGINLRAWLEHFPELAETGVAAPSVAVSRPDPAAQPAAGASPAVTPAAPPALSAQEVQRALDALISRRSSLYYYKLSKLGSVDKGTLKLVQINWHDNSGRLVKTIEADSLTVRLHEKGSSVELEMRNGAFLDGGQKNPFSSDTFRLFLPRQDLAEWRASGVPFVEGAG